MWELLGLDLRIAAMCVGAAGCVGAARCVGTWLNGGSSPPTVRLKCPEYYSLKITPSYPSPTPVPLTITGSYLSGI